MLDWADGNIIATNGRGVIERRGRRLQRRNAQAEVRADEGDAAARVRRMKLDFRVDAGVEADAGDTDFGVDRLAFNVHVRAVKSRGSATEYGGPSNGPN